MKIAFYELDSEGEKLARKSLKSHSLVFYPRPLTLGTADTTADIISGFVYSKFDTAVIDKVKKVKLIATRSTGYDHIDINECKKKKISVANVPMYGENTVAEHTFALILSLSRKIHQAYARVKENNYSIDGLMGFDLKGKTLGVIGTGNIGKHVIRMAKGFEMNVIAFDMFPNKNLPKELNFTYVSLPELLKKSDIVTLHIPYMKENHHCIDDKKIKMMKQGAIIINTARGALIDTAALLKALDSKHLAGAGLDVLEHEEIIREEKKVPYSDKKTKELETIAKGHLLLEKENVLYTPHIAFYSKEALARITNTTIENIQGFINGKIPEKNKIC